MGNLFNNRDNSEIIIRVSKIEANVTPLWGTMTANEMLCHIADVLKDAIGMREVKSAVPGILKPFMKIILLSKKPFRKHLPALKIYKQGNSGLGTRPTNFEYDKAVFKDLVRKAGTQGENYALREHPAAGRLNRDQYGYLLWKHTDHHLRQFGA